ncbi:hypothetical protein Cgig2_001994 [Carnegiea gigantea]|uniref:Uncharacterized protein n=1 Tax=Carnegiea gigantea TaxID=171969 RepID=A0A9Q1GJ36_9CARY|nr:hypothetical protein Cgig2_001994 [Carnegiea gigantea]
MLKNLISTMTNTVMQQVTEQVKAANSARPLPTFDYVPTLVYKPSHRHAPVKEHLILKKPQPMTTAPKPDNDQKYCEFHEQNGHTIAECTELRKDRNSFEGNVSPDDKSLRRRSAVGSHGRTREPRYGPGNDGQCPRSTNPDQYQELSGYHHMGLFKKLKHLGREIVPLVHHILGVGRPEVNLTEMICLPLRFGDKAKARNIEADFLVVDVRTAYNVILGWLTLHKVKAVIASYLLKLQFEADDGSVGKFQ